MSVKLSNLFSKSIDVGEETIADNKVVSEKVICNSDANKSNNDWWFPSKNGKKRIMLCGTYPIGASNGYSK